MNSKRLVAALTGAVVVFPACTPMPPVLSYMSKGQYKVSAVNHWNRVAEDAMSGLAEVMPDPPQNDTDRINIETDDAGGQKPSQFEEYLKSALGRVILLSHYQSKELKNAAAAIKAKFPQEIAAPDAASMQDRPCCDLITIKVDVVKHHGPVARTYPGKYTMLAEGLVVIRHLAHAFSDTKFVGAVGLGELAFWASSGFRSGDTVTELVVTTSYMSLDGKAFAENTNAYYIDSDDTALYRSQPNLDAGDSTLAGTYGASNPGFPNRLPAADNNARIPEFVMAQNVDLSDAASLPTTPGDNAIAVTPLKVSVCDSAYSFLVTGSDMNTAKSGYLLGTLPPSSVEAVVFNSDKAPAGAFDASAVKIRFNNQSSANSGLTKISLAMFRGDGSTAKTEIAVVGDPKSCAGGSKAENVAASAFGDLVLSGAAASPNKPVEICAAAWSINASGNSAATIDSARTKIGGRTAKLTKAGGVTVLTFDSFVGAEAKALGKTGSLEIIMASAKNKSSTSKKIAFTCSVAPVAPVPAAHTGSPDNPKDKRKTVPTGSAPASVPASAPAGASSH